jgi:Sarcosine oxidase A3 domain/Aminomethyltransferase folate-binding domain/2Fe-2S iron-sulfur cluster binding domain/FAD binding domain
MTHHRRKHHDAALHADGMITKDALASSLTHLRQQAGLRQVIANGVSLIAPSFKYHRPRGFYGAGLEDPGSMLAVRDAHGYDPAIRAGQIRLVEGLEVRSVSGSPSVNFDVGSIAQLFSGVLSAGFYYKTFMWPSWRLFEPVIRRATGFGRPKRGADHRGVEHRHASCDVLVIGSGPAGLLAARALRGTGLRVVRSTNRVWVDLQNDVMVSDIELAVRENYTSVEHLKRYTTLGMGTDQGRTSNVNGLAVLAELTGREISTVGTTTFRPPYTAVRMASIANERRGDLFRPRRYLPADSIHREHGAVMEDFGWERPDWYRSNGSERESAVAAEMRAVREHVGVFDGSSLGKIEITGPDAPAFLAKF